MSHLFSKAYKKTKQESTTFRNREELVGKLLAVAAKCMEDSSKLALEGKFEDRSHKTDRAIYILTNIRACLFEEGKSLHPTQKAFDDFLSAMNDLIIRMDIKNDAPLAEKLTENLTLMSLMWLERSREKDPEPFFQADGVTDEISIAS
jgi:flagellin-specific chaperone FliS